MIQATLFYHFKNYSLAICCLLSFSLNWVYATNIYRYEDEAGRIVYTNVPPKNKTKQMKLVTEPISVIPHHKGVILPSPKTITSHGTSNHKDTEAPNHLEGIPSQIDQVTQQGRDSTRRSILLDELNSEVQALTDAKKQLQNTPVTTPLILSPSFDDENNRPSGSHSANSSNLNALQQTIQSHERNIQALQKELGKK